MRKLLERIADDNNIAVSTKSIEQKQRNTLKRELTEALGKVLEDVLGDSTSLSIYRTEKGIMVGIDNEKVGIIPVEFTVAFKNLDCDPMEEEEAYKEKLAEAAEKKERAEKLKAQKIARQAQLREAKAKLKALQEAPADEDAETVVVDETVDELA